MGRSSVHADIEKSTGGIAPVLRHYLISPVQNVRRKA